MDLRQKRRIQPTIKRMGAHGQKYAWIQLGYVFTSVELPGSCDRQNRAMAMEGAIEFDNVVQETSEPSARCILNTSGDDIFQRFKEAYPTVTGTMYGLSGLSMHMDSVLTSAMAINKTLETVVFDEALQINASSFKLGLIDSMRETDFYGITGRIRFNAKGDRIVRVNIYQIRNLTRHLMAQFDPQSGNITWLMPIWFPDGIPTLDQPAIELQTVQVSRPWSILIAILSSLAVLLSIGCIAFNVKYREVRLIRMSSPNINNLIGIGCLLCYASCLVKAANAILMLSLGMCWLELCLICTGYALAYGALLAKTWRVHQVFSNRQMRRVVIKDSQLVVMALGVVLADALIIGIWAGVDPLLLSQVSLPNQTNSLNTLITVQRVEVCSSEHHTIWQGCLIGLNGLLLAVGIMFAWETRNIYIEELNDSKTIGICIYNTVVMGVAGIALLFVLPDTEIDLKFALVSICVLVCASTTVILVFGSKIYALLRPGGKVDDIAGGSATINNNSLSATGSVN